MEGRSCTKLKRLEIPSDVSREVVRSRSFALYIKRCKTERAAAAIGLRNIIFVNLWFTKAYFLKLAFWFTNRIFCFIGAHRNFCPAKCFGC